MCQYANGTMCQLAGAFNGLIMFIFSNWHIGISAHCSIIHSFILLIGTLAYCPIGTLFHHSNLFLNFLKLIVISTIAINARIIISFTTNATSTPSIINLRTA